MLPNLTNQYISYSMAVFSANEIRTFFVWKYFHFFDLSLNTLSFKYYPDPTHIISTCTLRFVSAIKQCIEIFNALTLEVNVKKYTRAFKFSFKINFKTKVFITKIKCHIYLLMISRKIGPPIWGGVTEYLSASFNWKKWHV